MIRHLVPTTLVLAAATVAATAAPALAATAAPALAAGATRLTLSIVADAGWARAVTLRCSPSSGGHPTAAKACTALKAAGGNPDKLKERHVTCTLQLEPVTAAVDGTWKGRSVTWSRTFGNSCELSRATARVFRF
jgi:hypothetical protein